MVATAAASGTTGSASVTSRYATSAAAPPPTPLNNATSCGIAVIATRRAAGTPIRQPTTIAPKIHGRLSRSYARNVTTIAAAAPTAPISVPSRAVLGDERPFSDRTKQMAAIR